MVDPELPRDLTKEELAESARNQSLARRLKEMEEGAREAIRVMRMQIAKDRAEKDEALNLYETQGKKYRVVLGSLLRISGPEFNTEFGGFNFLDKGAQEEAKQALEQIKWGGEVDDEELASREPEGDPEEPEGE